MLMARSRPVLLVACLIASAAALNAFSTDLEGGSHAGGEFATPLAVGGSYSNIEPAPLAAMRKDFFLVDSHIPYAGEIAGTDAFIPYNETGSRLKQFPADRNAKIVLYCRSGRMSEIAARVLALAGYTNVLNLSGGMIAWQKAGFSILQKPVSPSAAGSSAHE